MSSQIGTIKELVERIENKLHEKVIIEKDSNEDGSFTSLNTDNFTVWLTDTLLEEYKIELR